MQVQEEQQQQHDLNHMKMIKLKGKRTKRQRLPSLLTLAMPSTSSTDNSEEEEDMANCLILLAQGRHHHDHDHRTQNSPKSYNTRTPDHNNRKKLGLYIYECKTCNRCFPSFQALGGHRASHMKPKADIAQDQKQGVTSFLNDCFDNYYDSTTTNTTLTLQIPNNRATKTTITKCNKVHECSICGSEFTSGQALGGHMRRHRTVLSTTSTTTTTTTCMSGAKNIRVIGESPHEPKDVKRPRNVLELDLNLPAPDEDQRECKLLFQSKENVIVVNATSLVGCHY
ncbi:hypothetical protein Lal_00032850 [Lupinus albus]|uniref:Putative transcription factor C2H2 family n=1 Tax=Lupinus albus TaxID=3870 RepID=A0A6A5PJV9_LUPAL|nr:putative transcription factor C2H2 family [Lupinus albus]KAF1898086.1 hypothetical protein Lal_00032850 [Lupinus albus]